MHETDEKWVYEYCPRAEGKRYVERSRLKSGVILNVS
jgi:hypothetical protein